MLGKDRTVVCQPFSWNDGRRGVGIATLIISAVDRAAEDTPIDRIQVWLRGMLTPDLDLHAAVLAGI